MAARKERLNKIAEKFELDIIYAFGGKAKEVAEWVEKEGFELSISASSDVDIGVKPSSGKWLAAKEKVHLAIALEDFFSVSRVDLVVIPEVDPFMAANVIRGERMFAKNGFEADEYDLYVLRRAGDLAPLERERISLIMETDR